MSKAEFTETLSKIIDRMERIAKKEDDYLKTCKDGKKLFDLFEKMKKDKYYIRQFGQDNERKKREILTDAQKLKDKRFVVCNKCNSIMLKKSLRGHQDTKKCYDISISKEVSHKHKDSKYIIYKEIIITLDVHRINIVQGNSNGMFDYYNNE